MLFLSLFQKVLAQNVRCPQYNQSAPEGDLKLPLPTGVEQRLTNEGRDFRKKVTSSFHFVKITHFQLFSSLLG